LIGINIDKSKSDFETYTRMVAMSVPRNQQFPILWRSGLGKLEGFGQLATDPTHFLISPNGELILKREGTFKSEDWDNLWESLSN
jgi:hypothetical protein